MYTQLPGQIGTQEDCNMFLLPLRHLSPLIDKKQRNLRNCGYRRRRSHVPTGIPIFLKCLLSNLVIDGGSSQRVISFVTNCTISYFLRFTDRYQIGCFHFILLIYIPLSFFSQLIDYTLL